MSAVSRTQPIFSAEPLRDLTPEERVRNEALYALAFESLNQGVYDWDVENGQIYYSPTLRAMFGLPVPEAYRPEDWLERIHPDDRPTYRRRLIAHFKGETARFECEYRYGIGDSEWRWARHHGIAFRDLEGQARRMVGATGDITDIKRREQELQIAKAEAAAARGDFERARGVMLTILDNISDGVVLWDEKFRWKFSNRRHIEMWGYTSETLYPGVSVHDMLRFQVARGVYPTADVERMVEEIAARVLKPGGNRYERQTHDGKYFEFIYKPLADGSLLGFYRDITDLKDREQALAVAKEAAEAAQGVAEHERAEAEAANQAKSTFLATVSHEIRTPMNGVLGMMEVLERQGLNDEQRGTVVIMRDSAHALLRIIDDVLDFSKIEAGRLDLEDTAFSLSGLLEAILDTFRPQAVTKDLGLSAEVAVGSDDLLMGDPTRVRQILFNLVGNAVKFTDHGRVAVRAVTARLGEGRTCVTFSVSDTGIGLSASQRSRLFQPFAQADNSTTRRFGGTGLGLSIVRRLAELMDGDVAVESAYGIGSTFTVTLMLRAVTSGLSFDTKLPPAVRAARATIARSPGTDRPRVLVVDDNPVNREVLVRQLDLLGVAADTVNDGFDALEAWGAEAYAAVLADINMPRMDGHELARRLRAAEDGDKGLRERTPVVAVTANAMKGEEERCLAAGMDAYLTKPIRIEQLSAILERWLPLDGERRSSGDPTRRVSARTAIDRDVLAAWLGDDRGAVDSLLAKFWDTALESEREIGAAAHASNLASLTAAAHKLKGAAQMVGARDVAEAAAVLERAAKEGDWARCRDGLGLFAAELRRVCVEIGESAKST